MYINQISLLKGFEKGLVFSASFLILLFYQYHLNHFTYCSHASFNSSSFLFHFVKCTVLYRYIFIWSFIMISVVSHFSYMIFINFSFQDVSFNLPTLGFIIIFFLLNFNHIYLNTKNQKHQVLIHIWRTRKTKYNE